jgi:hypothetical protein
VKLFPVQLKGGIRKIGIWNIIVAILGPGDFGEGKFRIFLPNLVFVFKQEKLFKRRRLNNIPNLKESAGRFRNVSISKQTLYSTKTLSQNPHVSEKYQIPNLKETVEGRCSWNASISKQMFVQTNIDF